MPPKQVKVVPEPVPVAKEAKHKAKAAVKSEAADKKSAKATPKGKQSINNLQVNEWSRVYSNHLFIFGPCLSVTSQRK
jgi:hypothetical protein